MMASKRSSGFTLIELVIIISIIGILAIVALPVFQNLTTDARKAACQGALGGMRSAISSFRGAKALPSSDGAPRYPTFVEMSGEVAAPGAIMDSATGVPANPYSTLAGSESTILDAKTAGKAKGQSKTGANNVEGWYYHEDTGQIWPATEDGKDL